MSRRAPGLVLIGLPSFNVHGGSGVSPPSQRSGHAAVRVSSPATAWSGRRARPLRAVSGETDKATRRRVVDEFGRDTVKALVNYGVFSEGFDAPKTPYAGSTRVRGRLRSE